MKMNPIFCLFVILFVNIVTIQREKSVFICIHYHEKEFIYELPPNSTKWENDNYLDLIESIRSKFNLKSNFSLYENLDGYIVNIDDIDDVIDAIECIEDVADDDDDESKDSEVSQHLLHLHVKLKILILMRKKK